MKPFLTCLFSLSLLFTTAIAADKAEQPSNKTADKPAAVSAAEIANYPLKVCAVSGEELGSMGEPFDYIHQEAGQPDRLVRMCCDGCLKKFKKDPAKYLARIDAAKNAPAEKK
jgi:hypothetical protein